MTKRTENAMSETGTFFKADAVRFERLLPATPARVWELLTVLDSLPEWYGAGAMEPYPGGVVNLFGGHVRGIVTQWQPPRKLAYTWNVFSPGEEISAFPESYLTFELAPRGGEVFLTLTHLPVLERFVKQNAMGWHTFLDMLNDAARGKPVKPQAEYMQKNAALYGVDLQNLQK
jgi:uncharacterized protein YndB with AHSA1/START domain